ncbi:MAG: HAMP domain-containing protein, partial [Acidobacteriota bacterium]
MADPEDQQTAEPASSGPADAAEPSGGWIAADEETRPEAVDLPRRGRRGAGLAWKIALLTLVPLFLLASLTAAFAYRTLQDVLTEEFRDKGQAIATGIANAAAASPVQGDAATLQAQVGVAEQTQGVAYILITREDGSPLVHTLAPVVPAELLNDRSAPAVGDDELVYRDPENGDSRRVLEVTQPIFTDERLRVRVGMDLDRVERRTRDAALDVGTIGALALLISWLAALAVARRTVWPIQELVVVAERVGEGDLSELAPARSRDEIGVLAETFNNTIRRLRDLVQSEGERDQLRRQIHEFRAVATDISGGDLTRRGHITQGALGEVVVAINRMVGEIAELLRSARGAADTVGEGSLDMIEKTERMVAGSQAQARDAVRVSNQMGQVSDAIRSVSESADLAAEAANQTLKAAETGQRSVQASLDGMNRARQEVQTLSTRVESLAERSKEISEVV